MASRRGRLKRNSAEAVTYNYAGSDDLPAQPSPDHHKKSRKDVPVPQRKKQASRPNPAVSASQHAGLSLTTTPLLPAFSWKTLHPLYRRGSGPLAVSELVEQDLDVKPGALRLYTRLAGESTAYPWLSQDRQSGTMPQKEGC